MRKTMISLLTVAALATTGSALAHNDDADQTIDLTEAGGPTLYVDVETQGIWEETNNDPGLQVTSHIHTAPNGAQTTIPADTAVGQVPAAPDLP